MARGRSAGSRRPGTSGLMTTFLAVMMVAALLGGCTSGGSASSGPNVPGDAALRVTSVRAGGLDENARARFESEVSDVLARYVQSGFLGDYPRSDFVQSFDDFTSGAAEQAVADIDVLTAARFEEASSVRAKDLQAKLAFYVVDGEAVGATAWIDLVFDVEDHGTSKTAALDGRLMLDQRDGRWSVFAYDVNRDDSDALPTEVSSS